MVVVMDADELMASAEQRLGMPIQAVWLVRRGGEDGRLPRVWELLTEHGYFWLVERDGIVELFRAALPHGTRARAPECISAAEAVRRFLELHPPRADS